MGWGHNFEINQFYFLNGFQVLPGEYRLSSFAAKPESVPELLLLPPYVDVNVNRPLLNVRFHQVVAKAAQSLRLIYFTLICLYIFYFLSSNVYCCSPSNIEGSQI